MKKRKAVQLDLFSQIELKAHHNSVSSNQPLFHARKEMTKVRQLLLIPRYYEMAVKRLPLLTQADIAALDAIARGEQ